MPKTNTIIRPNLKAIRTLYDEVTVGTEHEKILKLGGRRMVRDHIPELLAYIDKLEDWKVEAKQILESLAKAMEDSDFNFPDVEQYTNQVFELIEDENV